jgi:hypothetical protein
MRNNGAYKMQTTMDKIKLNCDVTNSTLTMDFLGKPATGAKLDKSTSHGKYSMDMDKVPENIKKEAMYYGLQVKMSRNLAKTADAAKETSVDQSLESTKELWDSLLKGNWNPGRTSKPKNAYTASAVEAGFLAGVANGVLTYEAANALYMQMSGGKTLYKALIDDEDTDNDND